MAFNIANSKVFRNVYTMSSRRLGDLNVVNKQKYPFIIHTNKLFAEEDINKYNSRFPELIKSICEHHIDFKTPMERFATNISQLLPDRMLIEGLKIVELYKNITNSKSEEDIKNAELLGWCTDIIIHTIQINDDIMENNKVRWGKSSYYIWKDVGMYAVSDTFLMEHASYFLLKKFFGTKPWYRHCVETLHDMCFKTALGQSFEKCLSSNGKLQFDTMTLQNYRNYGIYKTAFAAVQLPLMLSHFVAENYDLDFPKKAKDIVNELGLYLAVQNDMANYVGDVEGTKNDNSDIGRGGFTWLITQALNRGSSSQKEVLNRHYGVNSPDSVGKVIAIFEDLKMFDLYEQFKKNSREYIYAETEIVTISRVHKNSILEITELLY